VSSDPVSPADTIRRAFGPGIDYRPDAHTIRIEARSALAELLAVGERDKAEIEALKGCPAGTGCAINSGAVHCFHCRRNWPRDETWEQPFLSRPDLRYQKIETMHGLLDSQEAERERDGRQIAQLTERCEKLADALRQVGDGMLDNLCWCGEEWIGNDDPLDEERVHSEWCLRARAVLAGEEDANG
jgi:hypothetical protein